MAISLKEREVDLEHSCESKRESKGDNKRTERM